MKIVLICNAGMSTSLLVQRMLKVAEERGLDIEIEAFSVEVLEEKMKEEMISCCLVGPQIRHMMPNIKKLVENTFPLDIIDMKNYGLVNGAGVLDQALTLCNK